MGGMSKLALIPHQDDDALFLAYTLMREQPMVLFCTIPVIQEKRGQATKKERLSEAHEAMNLLGLNYNTLSIFDDDLTEERLIEFLKPFIPLYESVYAPAIEGYQKQHDLVGSVADKLWPGKVTHYMTYTADNLHTKGKVVVTPTEEEMKLKNRALDCYESQLQYNRPHFDAVRNLPEYFQ